MMRASPLLRSWDKRTETRPVFECIRFSKLKLSLEEVLPRRFSEEEGVSL